MRCALALAFAASGLVPVALAQEVRELPATVDFTAQEVFFRGPVTYRAGPQRTGTARLALKIVIRGERFSEGARGPQFFLGELPADHHVIAPDGESVAVYFYGPRKLPSRASLVVLHRVGDTAKLKRAFDRRSVRWLPEAVRRQHGLPRFDGRSSVRPG